jgi:hypothetical protein
MFRPMAPIAIAVSFSCLVGCGDAPDIVAVEGTVTHKGKPIPGLRVYFQPTDGRPSWGDTDSEGRFRLDYDADYDGAKVGTHKVYVVDASALDPTIVQPPGGKPPEFKAILAKYGNPEISPKTVEITKAVRDLKLELD